VLPTTSHGKFNSKSPSISADEIDDLVSSICLEDVQPTDLVHGLSCGHAYHANCLETWLLTGHFLCPLCNQAFFDQIEPESSDV
jgi:hypothetical protein